MSPARPRSGPRTLLLLVEARSPPRHLPQQRRRTQPLTVVHYIAVQRLHHPGQTLAIGFAQEAAAEGREAEAEDDSDVDVRGVGDDPLFHAAGGLVEHLQPAALGDLAVVDGLLAPAEQAVDGGVDPLGDLPLLPFLIEVEAPFRFPAETAVGD